MTTGITACVPSFRRAFFSKTDKNNFETKPKTREPFFDLLRGFAIIAVIIIHVIYFFLPVVQDDQKNFIYILNNLLRFAVPWFLITSGALLQTVENTKKAWFDFYLKKTKTILLPYFFLTLIASLSMGAPLGAIPWNFVSGNTLLPYYFIVILIQCYLLYPILLIFKNSRAMFIATFIITLACAITPQLWYLYHISFIGQYIFFFFYGIYRRDELLGISNNKTETKIWFFMILSTILLYILIPINLYNVSLFYSIPLLQLVNKLKPYYPKTLFVCRWFESIGKNSLWIFLIHFPIVVIYYKIFSNIELLFIVKFIVICTLSVTTSILAAQIASFIYNYTSNLLTGTFSHLSPKTRQ